MSCGNKSNLTNSADYSSYLQDEHQNKKAKLAKEEIEFWQSKLSTDSNSFIYMQQYALALISCFGVNGDAALLPIADSLLLVAAAKLKDKEPNVFFALAQNAITQHKFKEAEQYVLKAETNGANAYTTAMLKFDVAMELGSYALAKQSLKILSGDTSNFNFIIRAAKYEDYLGNSEESVSHMEKAYNKVLGNNKTSVTSWVTTNLGDMYSHKGDLDKSYNLYLKALAIDSANLYALKGIAAIASKRDNQHNEALRILSFVRNNYHMPDILLDIAEVEDRMGRSESAKALRKEFVAKVGLNPYYGNMYSKHLIDIYCEDPSKLREALVLAKKEIENRDTPETNSWLAMTLLINGEVQKAEQLYSSKVYKKTHEPEPHIIGYTIFKRSNKEIAEHCKSICLDAVFELGPERIAQLN